MAKSKRSARKPAARSVKGASRSSHSGGERSRRSAPILRGPKGKGRAAPDGPYAALREELRQIATLAAVLTNISWDQETQMPPRGASLRAQQRQMLSAMLHERRTSRRFGDLLKAAESWAKKNGDGRIKADLRETRRDFDLATRLPTSLVAELARCASLGMEAWKEARQKSEFTLFLPWLKRTIELSREKARCLGVARGGELYDPLLDEYEPGMTAAAVKATFDPLRARLVPLIERVADSSRRPDIAPARVHTPIELQKAFVRFVCEKIGFDFNAGRVDESTHPFCDGFGPGDTRMTNRYRSDGWADALGTVLHESGHGLYEQGLPKEEHFGSPLAEPISLGIHESQSRMWENLIGRSSAFWRWAGTHARKHFAPALDAFTDADIHRAMNIVAPSFIRVESDELTYNLHIMLRFDLERAMVRQDLSPEDLPGVWNERIKSDLGLDVPDDRRGCLQDVHWSMGAVGYFPTYTLGNLYSAQFWEAMGREMPGREEMIARGEFAPVLQWLRDRVHSVGREFRAEELCERISGAPLSSDALMRHLERKVSAVYG